MDKIFKYINTSQIDDISGGDTNFKKELIDIFLEQIPEFVSTMSTSFEDKNWQILAREAHTAKSSVLTFGMKEAGSLLKEIQIQAENNKVEFLPNLLAQVLAHFRAAIPELHKLKASM